MILGGDYLTLPDLMEVERAGKKGKGTGNYQ